VRPFTLAQVLAEQHGVELQGDAGDGPDAGTALGDRQWQPLGRLLVARELLSQTELEHALAEQARQPSRRLGELLVASGRLTGVTLAAALAEQHGISLPAPAELARRVQTVLTPVAPAGPSYVVDVTFAPVARPSTPLFASSNFLEAVDFAFEYLEQEQPPVLEIQKVENGTRETVWTYSEKRAAAEAAGKKPLVATFGFDPARWDTRPKFSQAKRP
jgi:hypothetical protein